MVSFESVGLRYKEHLPLVLQDFCFETKPAEKVGVVGRTGAGKSSLFQALFRFVDIESGAIRLDGVNISQISLAHLRTSLSIIPQDPFLLGGTVRANLDPLGMRSDADLWDSLRKARMEQAVQQMDGGLDATVEDRGRSFSVGQRQLMCLARTILSSAKVGKVLRSAVQYRRTNLLP